MCPFPHIKKYLILFMRAVRACVCCYTKKVKLPEYPQQRIVTTLKSSEPDVIWACLIWSQAVVLHHKVLTGGQLIVACDKTNRCDVLWLRNTFPLYAFLPLRPHISVWGQDEWENLQIPCRAFLWTVTISVSHQIRLCVYVSNKWLNKCGQC